MVYLTPYRHYSFKKRSVIKQGRYPQWTWTFVSDAAKGRRAIPKRHSYRQRHYSDLQLPFIRLLVFELNGSLSKINALRIFPLALGLFEIHKGTLLLNAAYYRCPGF